MAVEVQCDVDQCKYNDSGECAKPVIAINDQKECDDFEH